MTDPKDLTTLPPLLIPRPAHLSFTHSPPHPLTHSPLPPPPPTTTSDPSLPHPHSYRLTITPTAIAIAHNSPQALTHAHATLAQLRTQYADRLPQLEILDYPAIPTRGLMLDISRDRIPTMQEFHRLIPELAALKLNHLQLYTEHTFAYTGHEQVWQGWNPITPAELLELQTLCAAHAIDLVPNQNCFGHLTHWLKHPRYAPLAETHADWIFDRFKRSGPFSLCPSDPGSIALVRDLLDQLLPLFPSFSSTGRGTVGPLSLSNAHTSGDAAIPTSGSMVNIGCDETYDIGQGRSKDQVAHRGKADVYFDFLDQVFDAVRTHHKRPMFWADVALNHPDHIHRIAGDAIALAWGYEADTDFDRWCNILCSAGKTTWVCPGTSSWRSITGRTSVRRANCKNAADAAAKHNLPGYLITDWGDAGHHQTWPIALLAIAEAADMAWNAGREPQVSAPPPQRGGGQEPATGGLQGEVRPSIAAAISLHCFQDRTLTLASWLADLGDIDADLRPRAGRAWFEGNGQPLHNASAHFADLAEPWHSDAMDLTAADFEPLVADLQHARRSLPVDALPVLVALELTHTVNLAELAARRAIARRTNRAPADLRPHAAHVWTAHCSLWPARSRPGLGFEDSLVLLQRLIDELGEPDRR
ncbi:MAG: family 20 glycosylhydrolase [Phycisphaerales bacterium]|nr:family 20 glycosylhydrolase [Phycisphaerales bacterium]